jgi:hypothetical protein
MSPGAYASITRVDYKTLDRLGIKPLGVYGSKDEIVRLLRSIGAVDENGRVIPASLPPGFLILLSELANCLAQLIWMILSRVFHLVCTS